MGVVLPSVLAGACTSSSIALSAVAYWGPHDRPCREDTTPESAAEYGCRPSAAASVWRTIRRIHGVGVQLLACTRRAATLLLWPCPFFAHRSARHGLSKGTSSRSARCRPTRYAPVRQDLVKLARRRNQIESPDSARSCAVRVHTPQTGQSVSVEPPTPVGAHVALPKLRAGARTNADFGGLFCCSGPRTDRVVA